MRRPSSPARRPSAKVPARVRAAFEYFDRNRSGFLDYRELRSALRYMGFVDTTLGEAAAVLRRYDDHPDGRLDLMEFDRLVGDIRRMMQNAQPSPGGRLVLASGGGRKGDPSSYARVDSNVRGAFEYFDRNRSGFLDYRELRSALQYMGIDTSLREAANVLRRYDDYPDGKLDVAEFASLV